MAEAIFDVILQATGTFPLDYRAWNEAPPPEGDFFLAQDFWIGKLPFGTKPKLVFDACEPGGYNFAPVRQYGSRYAFCRKVEPESSDYYSFDTPNVLGYAVFLSRLIHPTTAATHHSARMYFQDGKLKTIVPGHTQGEGTHAWIVADQWRDWLSLEEAEKLRECLPIYDQQAPDRVKRARRHLDRTFHSFYIDHRCASLVTAYESILKVGRKRAVAQFKMRVPRLAGMVGVQLTADEADRLYDDRSSFVHGAETSVRALSDEMAELYNRFEAVLREALLRASTDRSFAGLFSSDDAVIDAFGGL